MRRTEFALRVLLIYVAGALGAVGADGSLAAPFAVGSLFLTAELATRGRGRETIDRIVRVPGSIIVALVLGGLVLNLFPAGLTRQSWSAFWVVVSLAVLWWKRNERSSLAWLTRRPTTTHAWFAVSAAILVVATVVATNGANRDLRSPLQMWVQGKSPGAVTVAVSAGASSGVYRLEMDPMVTKTDAFDSFELAPGQSVERGLPAGGSTRYSIHLVDDRTGEQVRTVIVESAPMS